jgi:hypothetical protein
MKCPERFFITQHNIRKPILNEDNITIGEYHLLVENQGFSKCYEEDCAAWNKEKGCCRKMSE